MAVIGYLLFGCIVLVSGSPLQDPVIRKLDDGPRFQHIQGADGKLHLVDLWVKASDVAEAARYDPDRQNVYHLFTRQNPTVSQPISIGSDDQIALSNYDPQRRTIIIIHGWQNSAISPVNSVLVPAFLSAEDVNVIVVDWSVGADTNYVAAVLNTPTSGVSVARFISWLNQATGAVLDMYHIVGYSLGGHQAGVVGRNLDGEVAYITALDPALPGWITNQNRFRANDGIYTEVMHTNAGYMGYLSTLGHVDFYPNGGVNMPGCDSHGCSHSRCYFYMAESLTSGGFTGRRCSSFLAAVNGNCELPETLRMGGLQPKTGSSGVFYLETNAGPPFSRG